MTLREAYSGVRWYLREVSGESSYDRYVEHMRRDHPDQPVMSRRDYERRKMRMRDEASARSASRAWYSSPSVRTVSRKPVAAARWRSSSRTNLERANSPSPGS